MKKLLALLLATLMLVGLFAGCKPTETIDTTVGGGISEEDRYGGKFTLIWTPGDTLDPMKTSGWKSYCWSMNVYENVLSRDASGLPAPGVCDFELSADNLKLTLWVRDGVTFHDGSAVEIEDVLASIQRASKTVSRMKKSYVPVLKSETIEGNKLIIEFTEYNIDTLWYFTANQTWTVVMPKEICEKYGASDAIVDVADAIGTGPYKVKSFTAGAKVELVRYDKYIAVPEGRTGLAAPKKAYFDAIDVIAKSDVTVDMMKIVSGEGDFASRDEEMDPMYLQQGLQLKADNETNAWYYALNCDGNGPAKDANVRKAIAAALDYKELAAYNSANAYVGKEYCTIVTGAYESTAYSNADYHMDANVQLAKSYLQKAGYNGEEIVMLVASGGSDTSPIVKERLSAAGMNVKVEYMDSTAMAEFILNPQNKWDMVPALSAVCDMPSTIAPKIVSDSWTHAEKDALLSELGKYPVGSEKSKELWGKLDKIMADECPAIIVCQQTAGNYVMSSDLVWEFDGAYRFWWNAYWKNPEAHK